MSLHALLPWLLAGELTIVASAALGLLAATVWRRRRRRRLDPRVAEASAALAAMMAGADRDDTVDRLTALPASARVRVLAGLGATLRDPDRRLNAAVEATGLRRRAARRCRSRRCWRRLEGVRLFTLLGAGDDSVPVLLADPHPEVRAAAARWVADHPDAGAVAIADLLAMLGDAEPLPRFAAADALMRLGGAGIDLLAAHLTSVRSRPGREGAMRVAAAVADARLLKPALAHAGDESPRVRSLAADFAGSIGGATAVEVLTALLDDPDAEVRAAAAHGLGRLRHWPSAPRLADALRDPQWAVRQQSGLALVAMGPPGVLTLRGALNDADRFARDMARQLLDLPDTVLTRAAS